MLDLLQYYFRVLCNGMKTRFRMVMIAHPGPGIGFHKRFMWQIIIPAAMSTHFCKASNLMEYGHDIARIITKNEVLSILPDSEHYHIKINKIPTWCGKDDPMTIQMVHEELRTYIPEYKNMKQWRALQWLGSDKTICTKNFASIVVDMTNKHDRDILLDISHTQLFNYNCTITPYEDRPQVFQCSKCGMYSHHIASCKQPRCLLCRSKMHNKEDHPQEEKHNCVNCKGEHPSNHKECNARRNHLGLKPIPSNKDKLQTNIPKHKHKGKDK